MIHAPAMKSMSIETFLALVRAREPKSQLTTTRSVDVWVAREKLKLSTIAPDGFLYSDGPRPRKTFTQAQPKDAQ